MAGAGPDPGHCPSCLVVGASADAVASAVEGWWCLVVALAGSVLALVASLYTVLTTFHHAPLLMVSSRR